MNTQPLVCICIPNYNNEKTISETLDSIVNQTYQNIIIKIFDNASTDNSVDILREYEKKYENIKVFENKINIGGEGNFNRCIENMEGEYSAIYHSDDVYMNDIIEKEVFAMKNNDISAVFTNGFIINEYSDNIGEYKIPLEIQLNKNELIEVTFQELIKSIIQNGNFLICPTVMSKTETYKNLIKRWDSSKYRTAADLDVWLRFAQYKRIAIINEKLIKYRRSTNSFSFRRTRNRIQLADFFLVMDDYINKKNVILSEYILQGYQYSKFRDQVVIERNSVRNKIILKDNKMPLLNKNIILYSWTSLKNFKFYLAGCLFTLIRPLRIFL